MKFCDREVPPGTNSMIWIDFPVNGKSYALAHHVRAQVIDEFSKRQHLVPRGFGLLQVTHETDTDPNFIDVLTMDVPAFQLLEPARANLNLPVSGINPIADHEMVGQTDLHPSLPVLSVINGRVAVFSSTVVNH
jgi:hypothetical protein